MRKDPLFIWGLIVTIGLLAAVFADVAEGAVVVTNVTKAEFDSAWNDRVWYAEIQAGGSGNGNELWEVELGGRTRTDTGQTSWIDGAENAFSLGVDVANNLIAVFNGSAAGDGYPVTVPFNEIWVALRVNTIFDGDVVEVGHVSEGSILPNLTLVNDTLFAGWTGFKYHFNDRTQNIGNFMQSGSITPDIFIDGGASSEEWKYTVFAVNNPEIVPEPSTVIMLLFGFILTAFRRAPRPLG